MFIARIDGRITSTVKHKSFHGCSLLIGQRLDAEGRAVGEPQVIIDQMGAGRGVRVPDIDAAIAAALKAEHGYRHTAMIHSNQIANVTKMARAMNTTLFVHNAPCSASLGLGGPGFLSYSIATPTGEGVTSPLTFTRQRQIAIVGGLRII